MYSKIFTHARLVREPTKPALIPPNVTPHTRDHRRSRTRGVNRLNSLLKQLKQFIFKIFSQANNLRYSRLKIHISSYEARNPIP